jgi:hypothetical protein
VAKRISRAAPVTGDEIRDTWFLDGRGPWWNVGTITGYQTSEVDDLLRRVAAQLDVGRHAGPLIENATFGRGSGKKSYNPDAVDWFLGQLLLPRDHFGSAGASADPWRDVGDVAQLVQGGVSGLAERYPPPSKPTSRKAWKWFAGQCENAWRDFGHRPGVQLRERQVAKFRELRTAEQQTLTSLEFVWASLEFGWAHTSWTGEPKTVSAGGRRFTFQTTDRARSPFPVVAEIAARTARDKDGHFAKPARRRARPPSVSGLVDEAGSPVLYTSGENFDWRACFCVTFPDGRWLRFPVRGTKEANVIMTAVDQAGNKVARYRTIHHRLEITVHPDWELTDELALALAISAEQLGQYFKRPGGGG